MQIFVYLKLLIFSNFIFLKSYKIFEILFIFIFFNDLIYNNAFIGVI